MQIAGAIVALAGLGLSLRSALLLAGRGRPKRGPTPAFVIAGPYRRVRNPLLAGAWLCAAGLALASASPAMGVAVAAFGLALHLWVVVREEPALRRRFGEVYGAYEAHVPRWIPRAGDAGSTDVSG